VLCLDWQLGVDMTRGTLGRSFGRQACRLASQAQACHAAAASKPRRAGELPQQFPAGRPRGANRPTAAYCCPRNFHEAALYLGLEVP
jgi:hypothetical protein